VWGWGAGGCGQIYKRQGIFSFLFFIKKKKKVGSFLVLAMVLARGGIKENK
jgi:hypothetical protein